jgi:hypothetical protein
MQHIQHNTPDKHLPAAAQSEQQVNAWQAAVADGNTAVRLFLPPQWHPFYIQPPVLPLLTRHLCCCPCCFLTPPPNTPREFVLSFAIMDETASFLAERNIQRFLPKLAANESGVTALMADDKFKESNLMHSING